MDFSYYEQILDSSLIVLSGLLHTFTERLLYLIKTFFKVLLQRADILQY